MTHPVTPTAALVLDWNGTVVADLPRAHQATNAVLRAVDLPDLTTEEFRRRFTLPMTTFFRDLGVQHGDLETAVAQWNSLVRDSPATISPGAQELMRFVRAMDAAVIILSAASVEVIAADARRLDNGSCISMVIAPAEDKAHELRRLRQEFPRLAYIGDTDADIHAAREARVPAIGYSGGYHQIQRLADAGADLIISDLGDSREDVATLFLKPGPRWPPGGDAVRAARPDRRATGLAGQLPQPR